MTADGGVAGAVEAMRLGALDYLVKPFDVEELSLVIARARKARQSVRHRRNIGAMLRRSEGLLSSGVPAGLEQQWKKSSPRTGGIKEALPPVLIEGETGTGKTSIARWLHRRGPRGPAAGGGQLPGAAGNPGGIRVFGHERGAFTDARTARMGLFEAANGGTLFLDELPRLSPALPAKVLDGDRGSIASGGWVAPEILPVDTRVIAATNKTLKQLVAAGSSARICIHRLDLIGSRCPPLR